ncbi:MAG TPA: hypothetical protein DC038_09545 [Clostridiales bacterium]|nr:hypothetical protein [Clostridiales bacterium]
MTKLQNKLCCACIFLCAILEVLSIIGAYAADYFTRTRMGMLRHVVYMNGKWEKLFSIPFIRTAALCVIITLTAIACIRYFKMRVNGMVSAAAALVVLLSAWTVYFLIFCNTGINRAYYILSMCFIMATIFQNVIYHCLCHIKKI